MPQDTLSALQRIQEYGLLGYAWLLIISVWAGTARYLNSLHGRKPTFLGWLTDTVVSGFVGVVAAMTCQYYQLDFFLTSAITGIAAHNGTRSLYLIGDILKKNIHQRIDDEPAVKGERLFCRKKEEGEK